MSTKTPRPRPAAESKRPAAPRPSRRRTAEAPTGRERRRACQPAKPAETAKQTPRRAAPGARRGARRGCQGSDERDQPLRLLPGRTRLMSEQQRSQLVDALAELLTDWLREHPERLPASLRSTPRSGLVDGTRTEETR